ncbi:MAG: cytochrome C [Candidatus Melainabacteria bacterium HGW-Melainabacteria-1]|nr:MAG: cytochrome C [Candidatus Melainabacteria bacterium HGW-Melainabacteria-1]
MKTWMKVALAVIAVPVMGVTGIVGWVGLSVNQRLSKTYEVQPVVIDPSIKGDVALGERIVTVRNGCIDCHGTNLAGQAVMDNPAMGKVYAANLTPAALKSWSDGEIGRAIRHGVGKQGQPLVLMPAEEYSNLSQEDLAHVIAYLRSVPAIDKANEPTKLGPVASVLLATDKAPLLSAEKLDHGKPFSPALQPAETVEYGEYLAKTACIGCHQNSLKGGKIAAGPPDWPPASDLTQAALGSWDEAAFIKAMREGVNPSGHKIQPPMPVAMTAKLNDTELKALWNYLKTLKG